MPEKTPHAREGGIPQAHNAHTPENPNEPPGGREIAPLRVRAHNAVVALEQMYGTALIEADEERQMGEAQLRATINALQLVNAQLAKQLEDANKTITKLRADLDTR